MRRIQVKKSVRIYVWYDPIAKAILSIRVEDYVILKKTYQPEILIAIWNQVFGSISVYAPTTKP